MLENLSKRIINALVWIRGLFRDLSRFFQDITTIFSGLAGISGEILKKVSGFPYRENFHTPYSAYHRADLSLKDLIPF
jgi:hypothetical protein